MFTSCPACQRQYRVHAEQLMAADGLVCCGHCGQQFNAVGRLSDKPISDLRPGEMDAADKSHKSSTKKTTETSTTDKAVAGEKSNFDIPEFLLDPQKPKTSPRSRALWGIAALLLILVLAAQLAWFQRDSLLASYPELKPWAHQLCEKFNCQLIREYRTSDIKLLNRDVRLHPGFHDALLVNATMSNESDHVQPYPHIQFSLFDTNGDMIASRKFNPDEYLDNSINIDDGMPVHQPVHFVLEVTGPTRAAVSFEFRFL